MKDVLSKEKRYCTNEDYILREIAGETILVPTGPVRIILMEC